MLNKFALEGFGTYELKVLPDERGLFAEVLRRDWQEVTGDWIEQVSLSHSYSGMVRAWHRHNRGQVDFITVLKGALKICAYDDASGQLVEVVGNSSKPTVVRIPGQFWHGTKCVSDESTIAIYCMTRLYDYKNPDEERRPWNDPAVVPVEINGNKKDPRVNHPFDWFYPPYK
jgi:dTDP-4-dehydrorhamnose 3,5-epimerase